MQLFRILLLAKRLRLGDMGGLKTLRMRNYCVFNSEIFSAKRLRFPP